MHRTLSRALPSVCALIALGLAWACGSNSSDFGIDDLVNAKLHLELGGTGSGTVTSATDELEYEDEFNKSCVRANSPCEWTSDLDEFGTTTLTRPPSRTRASPDLPSPRGPASARR